MTTTAIAVAEPSRRPISVFSSEADFASGQRLCKALVTSALVPENYRGEGNMGNALIALDMANRMGIPPLMVMQNLDVIEGRPSWKSQFIIAALNSCGLFSPIRFKVVDLGEQELSYLRWTGPKGGRTQETVKVTVRNKECTAYAVEKVTGEVLEGPTVSIAMAVAEGWYFRSGSKWQTMEDLMLRYRSAAFFGRLYAPHILNGMPSADEVVDVDYEVLRDVSPNAEASAKPEGEKPAGRPRGVHAAMAAGKKSEADRTEEKKPEEKKPVPGKQAKPKPEPVEEPEDEEVEEVSQDGAEDDDVFDLDGDGDSDGDGEGYTEDGPADDDYQPA